MLPGENYGDQMQACWKKARSNHTNQILRIIMSFSRKEFDPDDKNSALRAYMIAEMLVQERYQNRQAVIFIQKDGKSGLVHAHILVNDVDLDGKGLSKEQYHVPSVREWSNKAAEKFVVLDTGQGKTSDKTTQTERAKREAGEWVYKDDIKSRVRRSMARATDEKSFLEQLELNGVSAEAKDSKKYGHYYTYELVDLSKKPEDAKLPVSLKARSYKLGEAYGPEALEASIKYRTIRVQPYTAGVIDSGSIRKQQEDTEREEPEKIDFDTFTKKILPPDESWVFVDEYGEQLIDEEKYVAAKRKYQDFLRTGKLERTKREPEPAAVNEPAAEAAKEREKPAATDNRNAQKVPAAEQKPAKHVMTHEEKMIKLEMKAREQRRRAAEGGYVARRDSAAVRRETGRKPIPNVARTIRERTNDDEMEIK